MFSQFYWFQYFWHEPLHQPTVQVIIWCYLSTYCLLFCTLTSLLPPDERFKNLTELLSSEPVPLPAVFCPQARMFHIWVLWLKLLCLCSDVVLNSGLSNRISGSRAVSRLKYTLDNHLSFMWVFFKGLWGLLCHALQSRPPQSIRKVLIRKEELWVLISTPPRKLLYPCAYFSFFSQIAEFTY